MHANTHTLMFLLFYGISRAAAAAAVEGKKEMKM
jgi:hypothetical protein